MNQARRHITCTIPSGAPDLALLWVAPPGTKPPADAVTALPAEWLYAGMVVYPTWHVEIDRAWLDVEFVEHHPTAPDLTEHAIVLHMVSGLASRRRWFATVAFRDRQMRAGDPGATYDAVLHPSRTTDEWTASLEVLT